MTGAGSSWAEAIADRYRIERELGRGGMAVVYLAHDLKHDRDVALKVLRPELSAALGRDRFVREIQLTARLQHPHILPVFDSGESAGQLWYTMPFVDGETLRVRVMREGCLPVDTAIQLASEVASALAYAHDAGVVHRDIKPENILLSRQGGALVADFGIAKALVRDEALTETGLALGTPAYMAPEQILGERPVRPQADVYALGVVLYEMLCGTRPFADSVPAAMLAKRLTDGAPLVSVQRPEVPSAVAMLVRDTLEVDPARRPASGAALAERLRSASVQNSAPAGQTAPARINGTWTRVLAIIGLAVVAAGAIMALRTRGRSEASIGVLPFENRSGDSAQEYLSEGVSDELTARLSAVPDLKVSPRSSTIRFRGSQDAPETIARKLGVTYLLGGNVARRGDSVRLSVELIDGPRKRQLWSQVYVGPARSLAELVDSLSRAVTLALAPRTVGRVARAGTATQDSLAYDYYLLAQHHWNRFTEADLRQSLAYSDSAIARDPAYVDAWIARANAFLSLSSGNGSMTAREALGPLRQAVDTILALDPGSGQAHEIRGMTYTFLELDWAAADREFRMSFALDPRNSRAYARATFLQIVQGHTDSALALVRVAQHLEPTSVRAVTAEGLADLYGRRYAEALASSKRALELDPYFPPGLQLQALALSRLGRHREAIAAARQSADRPPPVLAVTLAIVLAQADSVAASREVVANLERQFGKEGIGPGLLYRAYAALGDADRTFFWLDRAIAERSWFVAFIKVDPVLDQVRSDPRFAGAVAHAGLPVP